MEFNKPALVIIFALALALYMLPAFIAYHRLHKSRDVVMLATLLTGWTGLGWLLCLIWSASGPAADAPGTTRKCPQLEHQFFAAQARLNAAKARNDIDAVLTHLQTMCVLRDQIQTALRVDEVAA